MRQVLIIAVLAMVAPGSASTFAHDEFRIIGTVARHQNSTLQVKNREGKTISVRLDKQTVITRDKKKIPPAELKTGLSVVVDAYGDTEDDSLAIEIRVVPPIGAR
ncbi:MAG: hypothetical protein A3I61_16040 [Acidobacteria bacterium RIFCSPLOWO2_02_FULL_68_18]|nr:MAG: hypothetical protein A3I61_16040 [Acidobacteria bacterium RIFCSPLOWO2_02_FULL_68_18]OFW48945.1 MAG: hypothetical protein A3G77_05115 [Acidobacteria bacterium RIFCSPLOWO2_12_FULL_68_19]